VARPKPAAACGGGNAVGLTSILDRGQFFYFSIVAVNVCRRKLKTAVAAAAVMTDVLVVMRLWIVRRWN